VVNLRVVATVRGPHLPRYELRRRAADSMPYRLRWRGRWIRAHRIERGGLPRRRLLRGPLLVTELSATLLIAPGWSVRALSSGDLLMTRQR